MTAAKRAGPLAPHPALSAAFFHTMKDALEKPDIQTVAALRVVQDAPEQPIAEPEPDQAQPVAVTVPPSPAPETVQAPIQTSVQAPVAVPDAALGTGTQAVAPPGERVETAVPPTASVAEGVASALPPSTDAMSLTVPVRNPRPRGAPQEVASDLKRWGGNTKDRAVDMTLSLSPELADRLVELTGYEFMRLKRKTSASEVIRHLVAYAVSHVENNAVIATTDGLGLHVKEGSAR